jgi:hypothetical protein
MFKVTADFSGLERLQRKLEKVSGPHDVPVSELFGPAFMAEHTQFVSIDEMFAASGFKADSPEDFAKIPDDAWDKFVQGTTSFATWAEMKETGANAWVKKQLDL